MKRSEMVNVIREFVATVEYDYDCYMTPKDCDELLAVIQKAGMIPPPSKKYLAEGESPLIPGDFKDENGWFTPGLHGWEQE